MSNPLIELIRESDEDDVEELEREQAWLEQGHTCCTLNPSSRDWMDEGYNLDEE
jgi:hypothetical protein